MPCSRQRALQNVCIDSLAPTNALRLAIGHCGQECAISAPLRRDRRGEVCGVAGEENGRGEGARTMARARPCNEGNRV